jgi:hypothetical protein
VDLNAPVTLAAGTYVASGFNFQFTDFSGYQTKGTITPILLTGSGTTFTPVAIGDSITYAGATGFLSVTFGGIDTFTLGAGATMYGGLYWEATYDGGPELRMPVGYQNNTGNVFVVYGGGFGPGANTPEVGTAISGSAEGNFNRIYDFSIEVNESGAVAPAPPSLVLALTGVGLLGLVRFCRRL